MSLEDILVMEVPRKALHHVCDQNKLKPGGSTSEHYAKAIISNSNTYSIGADLAEGYRYAGRTAANFYQPLNGFPKELTEKSSVLTFLREKYGKQVFEEGIRPNLSETPQLFRVTVFENKLVLSYSFLGPEIRVLRDFQVKKERPQRVDYAVLHFNPLIVETRVPANKVDLFKEAVLKTLDIGSKQVEWFSMSELSNSEAQQLRTVLGGGLKGAKHKMTEGIYDTIEVKANNEVVDLFEKQEYMDAFAGKPYRSMTFRFPYKHRNGLEEEISVRITPLGVNFNSAVSEEVIQNVMTELLKIKVTTFAQVAATVENA